MILTNFPPLPFSLLLIYILQFHVLVLHGQIISIYYKDKSFHKQQNKWYSVSYSFMFHG